jgi:hypothetical protein
MSIRWRRPRMPWRDSLNLTLPRRVAAVTRPRRRQRKAVISTIEWSKSSKMSRWLLSAK